MKRIALLVAALTFSVIAPAPSHAAAVDTVVAFADTTYLDGGKVGLWVALHSEDPRCEHGRVVRVETRNPGQAWKTIGADTTKQTAVAAMGYLEADQKAQTRFVVAALTLADGTVCRSTSFNFAVVRTQTLVKHSAQRGPGGVQIGYVGAAPTDYGRSVFAGVLYGSPAKCLPNRLVILEMDLIGDRIELARDTTAKYGVFGYDFMDGLGSYRIVVPKKVLADGTVCPRLEVD